LTKRCSWHFAALKRLQSKPKTPELFGKFDVMDLKLLVHKRKNKREIFSKNSQKTINFAVMDLDKATGYPANFICVLPKQIGDVGDYQNIFSSLFGKESQRTAEKLLTDALKVELDPEIALEIEKRLKLLQLSQVTKKEKFLS
jgi:hypothetical protein